MRNSNTIIPIPAIIIYSIIGLFLIITIIGKVNEKAKVSEINHYYDDMKLNDYSNDKNIYDNGINERDGSAYENHSNTDYNQHDSATENTVPSLLRNNDYVHLSVLKSSNHSHKDDSFEYYDTVTDNFGTTYSNGIGGSDSDESWNEYQLDGGTYKEIRGRVVLNYDTRTQTSDDVFLWIYGDNIVLYMSQPITAGCEPQDFKVDLTGVKTLKVVISGMRMLRLVDCYLYTDTSGSTVSTAVRSEESAQSRIYLSDLMWFNASDSDGGFIFYDSAKDNFGTRYANALGGNYSGDDHFQEYLLNGSFVEMRGRVILNYDSRTQISDDVFLWIYGDDELLFQSQGITAGCEPQDFTVNIVGISKLKVVIRGRNMLRLVDCCLYKDSSVATVSTAVRSTESSQERIYLSDMEWFNASDSDGGFIFYDSVKDNYGSLYANGLGGNYSGEDHFEEYLLNGSYTEMCGRVVLNFDSRTQTSDDVYLWIYADGVLVYQSQLVTAGCDPQDFTVDLTGVNKLKVVIRGRNMLRLVDCILYK